MSARFHECWTRHVDSRVGMGVSKTFRISKKKVRDVQRHGETKSALPDAAGEGQGAPQPARKGRRFFSPEEAALIRDRTSSKLEVE